MKKLLILSKSLLFLLYFIPFLLIPKCNTTKEPLSSADSANAQFVSKDSIKNEKPIELKEYNSPLKNLWDHMLTPTPTSLSGFGLSAIATVSFFADKNIDYRTLLPVGFLLIIISFIFLFLKNKPRLQLIFSISIFLFLAGASLSFIFDDVLWGYYAILIFAFIDVGLNAYNYWINRRSRPVKNDFQGNNLA